jgi:hypothetical protein
MLSPIEQLDRAKTFHRLHVKGDPIVLFNVWDAGTARVVAGAGAKAIATGSWSVAAAQGCSDGQVLTLTAALDNLARIVASVTLPVTIDLEAGMEKPRKLSPTRSPVRLPPARSVAISSIRSLAVMAYIRSTTNRGAFWPPARRRIGHPYRYSSTRERTCS